MNGKEKIIGESMKDVKSQADGCIKTLLEMAKPRKGEIVIVGCSTSEVCGAKIGSQSNEKVAEILFEAFSSACGREGVYLAIQCCEHLNRAVVVERECAEKYMLEEVNVLPALKAGGALSIVAYRNFKDPVVVESIRAHAGMDIGDTIIGMHLKPVVVPLRGQIKRIGEANVVLAKTRKRFIGGPRAQYIENTP